MILQSVKNHLVVEDGAVTVDWVVLTAAVVGLGLVSVASVRGGASALATDIQTSLTSGSVVSLGMMGNVGAMLEGDWSVGAVSNGVPSGGQSTWTFTADGNVRSGSIWAGTWTQRSDGSLDVSITAGSGWNDTFTLTLNPDGSGFSAYQNGVEYRRAVRP